MRPSHKRAHDDPDAPARHSPSMGLEGRFAKGNGLPMRKHTLAVAIGATLLLSLAGCSEVSPGVGPTDGQLLTRAAVAGSSVPGAATLSQIYYWCQGQRVEAYLTVPTSAGQFPLLVRLHGGSAWNGPSHSSFGWSAALAGSLASSSYVELFPEYQGYMGSTGAVRGLRRDAEDTICGIHAAESTGRVRSHELYLIGASIGGGVALKVAGDLPHVRAVVAISPWVGINLVEPWETQHALPGTIFASQLKNEIASYGRHPSPAVLAQQSPAIAPITAPTLLLQGTADHHVPWQTVQEFAQAMKAAGKTVQLTLFPGGHHGLHGRNGNASTRAAFSWLLDHGLPPAL